MRNVGASPAEKCCALWRPVLRQSVWTRNTSPISAVPSVRAVSGHVFLNCDVFKGFTFDLLDS